MKAETIDPQLKVAWGAVAITGGKYIGRFGYYDDDEGPWKAVVYLWGKDDYVFIDHVFLTNIEMPAELELWENTMGKSIKAGRK